VAAEHSQGQDTDQPRLHGIFWVRVEDLIVVPTLRATRLNKSHNDPKIDQSGS